MTLSRRQFIQNMSLGGGALTLGLNLTGCSETPLAPVGEEVFRPNAFLSIDTAGRVLIQIHRAEMGQGVVTGIITLIAEELEVDPAQVDYEMAPVHPAYANVEYRLQMTGGSNSIRSDYENLRRAGATAREMLLQAAALDSGLPITGLQASEGKIVSGQGNYSKEYADLVLLASAIAAPDSVALKSANTFKLIGHYDRRLDAAGKTDGSALFGIDVQPRNCAVAVVVRSPHHGGALVDFDAEAARRYPGVVDVFAIDQGVAVVASGYWPARKAAELVTAKFSEPNHPLSDSEQIREAMNEAFEQGDFTSVREDSPETTSKSGKLVQANYYLPFLAHATMEPQNATAVVTDDHCEVWVGSQSPDIARDTAASVLGRSRGSVTVHNHLMGGGFGRRIAADNVAEVVAIAVRMDRPVKLIWSREDDTHNDFYRPAMAGRLQARVDEQGNVSQWQHLVVGPSINQQVFPQFGKSMLPAWIPAFVPELAGDMVASSDSASVEGAKELPYNFDGVDVQYCNLPTLMPLGYWRSVGHSHTAFVVESFVDELAHAAGQDPLAFRLQHLPADSRQRRVLEAVAEKSNWGRMPPGQFQGVAVHESFQTVVAEVARISIERGRPVIEQYFAVVDCGLVVNPDIVRDQMESGIAFGLTAALHGEITLENGAVQQSNFHDYPILRHNEMPVVDVTLMPSDAAPTGVGEPGTPPAAPALANAIFAATGQRHRELPLRFS